MAVDSARIAGIPLVIAGPWTREARERAAARDVREAFIRYFRKAIKTRNWTPWDDFPVAEIRELGPRLSEDTVIFLEASLGVEDYVGDYVEDGLNILNGRRERRQLQIAWGNEELKHAEAWEQVLLLSGRRTARQLEEYRDRVAAHTWRMRDEHPGLDTPLGVACYAMVQERATYYNYEETRKRIRAEYGLPERLTEFERKQGRQIGAAQAVKLVANDEIAHHGIFLEMVKIYTRYLPYDTLDTLLKVIKGFKMPALRLIPNASELAAFMQRTLQHTPLKQVRFVQNPILDALGLEGRRALERAVQQSKLLPAGLGPEHVVLGRTGEFVIVNQPEPAEAPAESAQLAQGTAGA